MKIKGLLIFNFIFCFISIRSQDLKMGNEKLDIQSSFFEENKGQVKGLDNNQVNFYLKQGNVSIFILKTGMAYQFSGDMLASPFREDFLNFKNDKVDLKTKRATYRMDIELVGMNPNAVISTEGKSLDFKRFFETNYEAVHNYSKVIYHNVYPNIDWVIYVDTKKNVSNSIKYDFIVHPGGNPSLIKLKTKWVEDLKLESDGGLTMGNRLGVIKENAPLSFQKSHSGVELITTKFKLDGDIISFDFGKYDSKKELLIDPSVVWSTFYGGEMAETQATMCVDKRRNVYIAGRTNSSINISLGGFENANVDGDVKAYLAKFDVNGSLKWATYYGGIGQTFGTSCAADTFGNIYLAGHTFTGVGIDFNGHQAALAGLSGASDLFLVKFNSGGLRLWGTYYGGDDAEVNAHCTTDLSGNVYLAGVTSSSNNIDFGGHQNTFANGVSDNFLVKFSGGGIRLWGTYYGGPNDETNPKLCTDINENVYMSGNSTSTLTGSIASSGHQNTANIPNSGYLAKFDKLGARQWGTYYDGEANSCATDALGDVYLAGSTIANKFISSNGFQMALQGKTDGYLVKFNSAGSRQWGTYYGGDSIDVINSVRVDDSLYVFIGGSTKSFNNIAYNGIQNSHAGGVYDGFMVKFDTKGKRIWSSYYGSTNDDFIEEVASDSLTRVFIAGTSNSANLGVTFGAHQILLGGTVDAFLVRIYDTLLPQIEIKSNVGSLICKGKSVTYTTLSNYGGSLPTYKWYVNRKQVGTGSSYVTDSLKSNDTVYCIIKSNHPNVSIDTGVSNSIVMTVRPVDTTHIFDTICDGNVIKFNGEFINSIGIYFDTLTSSFGCDSFIHFHLWVRPLDSSKYKDTICANDSLLFNGEYLKLPGKYRDTLIGIHGCDSFVELDLFVNPTSYMLLPRGICATDSFFFNGVYLKTAGIYFDTLKNRFGCDSLIQLNLGILTTYVFNRSQSICANDSLLFNGVYLKASGVYRDTFIAVTGCDSIVILNLTLTTTLTSSRIVNICGNQAYLFNGNYINTAGIYKDTFVSSKGCDSIETLTLNVIPTTNTTIYMDICANQSFFFNGVFLTTAGVYYDTLIASTSCDSFITLNLNVDPFVTKNIFANICINQTYFFNGMYLNSSGVYADTFVSSFGCDSIVLLNLSVKPIIFKFITVSLCKNQSYFFDDQYLNTPGFYYDTLKTSSGCDSLVFLTLKIGEKTTISIQNGINFSSDANNTTYQWYRCNPWRRIANETNKTFTTLTRGSYAVVIDDGKGCRDTSNCLDLYSPNTSGIASIHNTLIQVFPNPAKDRLYIQLDKFYRNIEIELYDMLGKKINSRKYSNMDAIDFDIQAIAKGIYTLHIRADEMQEIHKLEKE